MRASAPRIISLANDRGAPGSVVITSMVGPSLDTIGAVRFSGAGVLAHLLRRLPADTIELAIVISADAAPGPRAVLLTTTDGSRAGEFFGALFHVLPLSGYHGDSGIGSQLI